VHGPATDHYTTLISQDVLNKAAKKLISSIVRHKTTAGCELSTLDLVGHRRGPERALWRRKQARSDAAEARLSVRAIIDCDYSTVIFNDTRHHDEYMRTMTKTLKAGLLASGQGWSEAWSEDGASEYVHVPIESRDDSVFNLQLGRVD
jgi:hypothetical protein